MLAWISSGSARCPKRTTCCAASLNWLYCHIARPPRTAPLSTRMATTSLNSVFIPAVEAGPEARPDSMDVTEGSSPADVGYAAFSFPVRDIQGPGPAFHDLPR